MRMVPILDMPEVRSRAVPLSVAAYESMTAQGLVAPETELIRGIIVRKMSKSPLHAQLTDRLFKLIFLAVGERAWVRSEAPVVLDDSVPEPDVSVVAGRDSDYGTPPPPRARSSWLKSPLNPSPSTVKWPWLMRLAASRNTGGLAKSRTVECFSDPQTGVYQRVRQI